jgi:ketosteroid isomerase-like protein
MTQISELVQRGLRAWSEGDLNMLEAVLDPDVTLRWIEPGPWDCTGRDEVMGLLRERQAEVGSAHEMQIEYLDEHTVVVSAQKPRPQGAAATRITIAHGKVVAMQQYDSHDEACSSAIIG